MFTIGKCYCVETVLGNYLTELVEVVGPYSIIGKRNVYIGDTGRNSLFFQGQFDDSCELEVHPPESKRMFVFTMVEDWPHPIPTESI